MAKRSEKPEEWKSSEYYKLHTGAIDDLVNANEENSPEVSREELDKYRSGSKIKVADWVKALFIKFWFSGAVCFFIFWGLGTYVAGIDMMLVMGIALGVVTDILVNNIYRFYEKTPGANDRWMMFPKKRYASFFFNILYAFVLLACEFVLYNIVNIFILRITGQTDTVPLGVEPILFGIFYTGFDVLFIGMKHLCQKIISDARNKTDRRYE